MSLPTRRAVAKGAAWAVPVIAVGAPVPLAAASPIVIIEQPTGDGAGCKEPGKSFSKDYPYAYRLNLGVTTPVDGVVSLQSATSPGGTVTALSGQSFPVFVTSNPNAISVVIGSTNSANGTAILTFVFNGQAVPVAVSFGQGFHPCDR